MTPKIYVKGSKWSPVFNICLFVWGLYSHLKIFHLYGDIFITGEGLLLTYAQHSWTLSGEDSLACHMWHKASVYNGHFRGPVTLIPIAEHLAVELSLPVLRLRSVAARTHTQSSACKANAHNHCRLLKHCMNVCDTSSHMPNMIWLCQRTKNLWPEHKVMS